MVGSRGAAAGGTHGGTPGSGTTSGFVRFSTAGAAACGAAVYMQSRHSRDPIAGAPGGARWPQHPAQQVGGISSPRREYMQSDAPAGSRAAGTNTARRSDATNRIRVLCSLNRLKAGECAVRPPWAGESDPRTGADRRSQQVSSRSGASRSPVRSRGIASFPVEVAVHPIEELAGGGGERDDEPLSGGALPDLDGRRAEGLLQTVAQIGPVPARDEEPLLRTSGTEAGCRA